MDVVQLTTHIDATAVQNALAQPPAFVTREARDEATLAARTQSSGPSLLIFDGDDQYTHSISSGIVRIGRSITADIQLEDPMVSRKHAVVEVSGDAIRVLDDRSLNGVYVNGERVEMQSPLRDDDEIQIGAFVLRLIAA
jgi:pSer/pThr/pTyr-binding forkhead associated (FHA) protein